MEPQAGTFTPAPLPPMQPATEAPTPARGGVRGADVAIGIAILFSAFVLYWFILAIVSQIAFFPFLFEFLGLGEIAALIMVAVFSIQRKRPGIAVGMGIGFAVCVLIFVTCAFIIIRSLGG